MRLNKVSYLIISLGLVSSLYFLVARIEAADGNHNENSKHVDPADTITLTDNQIKQLKLENASYHNFNQETSAVGYIDFNQDKTVQVFTPYQGRIRQVFAKAGDDVKKGDVLFTVDSPDLVQAESNLILTAGVLKSSSQALQRAKAMFESKILADKDLEQAISDQQTAEANFKAAIDTIRIFGKSQSDIEQILVARKVDVELAIKSPINGRVTDKNATPGLLVQPGTLPAPYIVADISTLWMIANVIEEDMPKIKLNQPVSISVMAYPGENFKGKVTNIGAAIDPATHRIYVRSEIDDPKHKLKSQMLATFVITTGKPLSSIGIPLDGIVREGDGTISVFVTSDDKHFTKKTVQIGMEKNGYAEILKGISLNERVVTSGALFLSNQLALATK
jgi:membrane fusion protein, heavy metal efflux system